MPESLMPPLKFNEAINWDVDNEFEVPDEEIRVNRIEKSVERISALSLERQ